MVEIQCVDNSAMLHTLNNVVSEFLNLIKRMYLDGQAVGIVSDNVRVGDVWLCDGNFLKVKGLLVSEMVLANEYNTILCDDLVTGKEVKVRWYEFTKYSLLLHRTGNQLLLK